MFVATSARMLSVVAAVLALSSAALADSPSLIAKQSYVLHSEAPTLARATSPALVAPKLATKAPAAPAKLELKPPSTLDVTWRAVVDAALAPLRGFSVLLPSSSATTTRATASARSTPPVATHSEPARREKPAFFIQPKPIVAALATGTPYDTHGESVLLPGLEARLPWRIP